jgi:hypothetical protein
LQELIVLKKVLEFLLLVRRVLHCGGTWRCWASGCRLFRSCPRHFECSLQDCFFVFFLSIIYCSTHIMIMQGLGSYWLLSWNLLLGCSRLIFWFNLTSFFFFHWNTKSHS